jgi:hypothetical protein
MSAVASACTSRAARRIVVVALGLALAAACAPSPTLAQGTNSIPNFAPTSKIGWLAAGTGWISPASGPGPVQNDKNHRYVPNNTGGQPTFRVADLDNPIL